MVADIDDRRVLGQVRAGGADVWHHNHIGGVLDELGGVAVVGVVVVGARRHNQVGLERADQGDDRAPVLERRQQLAVVVVEQLVADADHGRRRQRLGAAALDQLRAGHLLVPGVAVGERDEQDLVALLGVERRHAASRELAVVGVGAEDQHAQSIGGHA